LKKVLIITYYWPPTGGVGVQRWLKFSKYLPEYGWEPIIYTPENPEMTIEDHSNFKDVSDALMVVKQPIWEPYDWYRKILGKKDEKIGAGLMSEGGKEGWGKKLAVWMRGNLFIPDPRKFWIKPSIKYLSQYVSDNDINHVITTGPPHSMHMIGLGLKRESGINWIADFRDPWTNIDFYKELMLTGFADRLHRKKEKEVIKNADAVVTVGPSWAEDFKAQGAKQVEVIYNGFDKADFPSEPLPATSGFTVAHIGSFSKSRNHQALWEALSQLRKENDAFDKDLKILTLGHVDGSVADSIKGFSLDDKWTREEHVPRDQVLAFQRSSNVLLLMVNDTPNAKGILPGKLFEYLASGRPILCIGRTDGDSTRVIKDANCGKCVGPQDLEGVKKALLELYDSRNMDQPYSNSIDAFSRQHLAGKLADILNGMTN
jgi:glycosyltransferase involved in cell wall biosynthesis